MRRRRQAKVRRAANGQALLNVGCGASYSSEWTNVDLKGSLNVIGHDIRQTLPFGDDVFDAVYSSHVLEHLALEDGRRLLRDFHRVLRPGGVCRLAVPDLEVICRELLKALESALAEPSAVNIQRYEWMKVELIDQMVRQRSGGRMLELLEAGEVDWDFVSSRCGSEFLHLFGPNATARASTAPLDRLIRLGSRWRRKLATGGVALLAASARDALTRRLAGPPNPQNSGESHKWMYDRLSLRLELERAGFVDVEVTAFDTSRIAGWDRWHLDATPSGRQPRKPDSLFVECRKPGSGITPERTEAEPAMEDQPLRQVRQMGRRILRRIGVLHGAQGASSDYRLINRDRVGKPLLEGWKSAVVAQRQDEAYDRLLHDLRAGQPRLDFQVAAESVKATGLVRPSLLEVGCGSGYYHEVFNRLVDGGVEYTGLDYSPAMLARARERFPGVPFVLGDATALPFDESTFDIVFNGVSLMHIADYPAAIAESCRVADRFCIFQTVPVVSQGPTRILRKRAYGRPVVEIVFNETELMERFADNGLVVCQKLDSIEYDLSAVLGEPSHAVTYLCQRVTKSG